MTDGQTHSSLDEPDAPRILAGLWVGLTSNNGVQAYAKTVGYVLFLPWVTFFAFLAVTGPTFSGTVFPQRSRGAGPGIGWIGSSRNTSCWSPAGSINATDGLLS